METSLYLFPRPVLGDPPDLEAVRQALKVRGVLGAPWRDDRHHAGPRFAGQITFAGCSPHLVLEPPAPHSTDFTHLRLFREEPPRLRITPRRSRPRCPACGGGIDDWQAHLPQWRADAARAWRCSRCGSRLTAAELDWRQYAVAARLLVEITRVWPGEALPDDGLLVALEEATGRLWSHAWAESSDALVQTPGDA